MSKKLSDHFSWDEMKCRGRECNCGRADMDPEFMTFIEEVRRTYGRPMYISSAFRCDAHNATVSKFPKGPHTYQQSGSLAADVLVSGQNAMDLYAAAKAVGAHGIGVSQKGAHKDRCIHLDIVGGRTTTWSY